MSLKEMLPRRQGKNVPVRRGEDLFATLQQRFDSLLDEFRRGRGFGAFPYSFPEESSFDVEVPKVDVAETANEVQITADLPGMDEKNVEVTLSDHNVAIHAEKGEESETEKKNYYLKERTYGSFDRIVGLPEGVDADKAKATFKKGVLTITLPKTEQAKRSVRKVAVQSA